MILGELTLQAPYQAGSGTASIANLGVFINSMDAYPSRLRIYSRNDLTVFTTYLLTQAGGSIATLGPVLEGTDRAYAVGDLVWLQCNLADASSSSYSPPAFTAFSVSGVSSPIEVGGSISGGSYTFEWSTSNSANVAANSISIVDTTASNTLASGLANTGSDAITLSTITNNSAATQTWTINAKNTQAAAFSDTYSVAWEWRVYAGTSSNVTLTANQIKALTDADGLQSGFAGTYAYANTNGYKYFCYPDALGSANNFIDAGTGLPVSMATSADNAAYDNTANGWSYALVSVTNANSVTTNYRVYRSQYSFSGSFTMEVS